MVEKGVSVQYVVGTQRDEYRREGQWGMICGIHSRYAQGLKLQIVFSCRFEVTLKIGSWIIERVGNV